MTFANQKLYLVNRNEKLIWDNFLVKKTTIFGRGNN